MDPAIQQVLNELKDIKLSNADLKKDIKEFKTAQDVQTAEFRKMFNRIQKENTELKSVVKNLTKENVNLNAELNRLSFGLNSIYQDKLVNNLIISGVSFTAGENLTDLVIKIADKLKVKISQKDFKVTRLVPKEASKKKFSNLLVEFNEFEFKKDLLANRKKTCLLSGQLGITGDERKIYFFHHLTVHNLNLLNETRKLKESLDIKFVWFQNNQVLVRKAENEKILSIKSKNDLQNFSKIFGKKKELVDLSGEIIDVEASTSNHGN